ncbi:MAG: YgaP family membrane protein [Spirochaetales bacterium]
MVKNMGKEDKVIRIVLALVIGLLILTGQLVGWGAVILGILAVVFIGTSVVGTCPIYIPFNISTLKKSEKSEKSEK